MNRRVVMGGGEPSCSSPPGEEHHDHDDGCRAVDGGADAPSRPRAARVDVRPNEREAGPAATYARAMAEMTMRDESRAGHVLGGTRIVDLPDEVSVRDVVRTRIRGEVAAYNDDPGPVFHGLVQPADAVRHSDGFRMRQPRPLDAESLIAAAEEAIGLGLLRLRLDDRPVDLDELIAPADHDELIAVLERSVVASAS